MKLTGTVLRCSARRVNASGGKETYVTNLLVLDPDNASGSNYAIEVWDERPHEARLKSEVTVKIVGVVSRNAGVPTFRGQLEEAEAPAAS
jgi:hypothetical protein